MLKMIVIYFSGSVIENKKCAGSFSNSNFMKRLFLNGINDLMERQIIQLCHIANVFVVCPVNSYAL